MEKVHERLKRATAALEQAGVPYAVIGGNAVAAWVTRVDESAVRYTRDVDILLRRDDLNAAMQALAPSGFIYRHVRGIDMFLDGPGSKVRDAVHVIFAGEKVRPVDSVPAPEITDSDKPGAFRVVTLDALVRMKLTSFRDKDRMHIRDMLDVGLIDAAWCSRVPPALAVRLQEIIDSPEGLPGEEDAV